MRKVLILFLLSISFSCFAQYRQLRFTKLTVEEGMPENNPYCHLEDSYGYHWFGTQAGLVRYDGYQVKKYRLKTTTGYNPRNQNIRSIVEDKAGNIWVSTLDEGIFKLERGTEYFTNYRLPDESSNYGARVRLQIDKEGKIWSLFSRYELNKWQAQRLDPFTGKFTIYDSTGSKGKGMPSGLITDILLSKDSGLWISGNHGLHYFDYTTGRFKTVLTNHVNSIYKLPSEPDAIWMIIEEGQKKQLAKYEITTKKFECFRPDEKTASISGCDKINYLFETKAKDIWVSTYKGIALFDREHKIFKPYLPQDSFPADSLANYCSQIWEGKHGSLWIRTRTKGLLYLSSPKTELKRFTYQAIGNQNWIPWDFFRGNSFMDSDSVLWLITGWDGIRKLDEKASLFEIVKQNKQRPEYTIENMHCAVEIDKENAWLINKGILNYNKKQNSYLSVVIPFLSETVSPSTIIKDRTGILWMSTWNGLISYDPTTKKARLFQNNPADTNSLSNNDVRCIYEDAENNLWIGTSGGGLNKLNRLTGKFTRYPYCKDSNRDLTSGFLDDDQVQTILEDKKGRLWIGTNNGALNLFNPATARFRSFYKPSEPMVCVTNIYEDSKGRLWLGTYLSGLFLFDSEKGKVSKRFSETEGLAYNIVNGIKEDKQGRIWVGSDRGFTILNGNDLSLSYLNTSNGLPDNSFKSAGIYDLLGDWVIGTNGGFIRFNPDELVTDTKPPKVLIESIVFNHNKTDSTIVAAEKSKIVFQYNENRLEFQFVGLNYNNPALIRYEYKLEGSDGDWIKAGNQRSAIYTNLSRGDYRFLVRAANGDGVWSQPVSIDIVVLPPWWKTWWAYVLYVLLFGYMVWSYIQYRSKKLKQENKILEEKVQDRTAELQHTIETLKTTQDQLVQQEKMASLGELTAGIAHEIQNPLNFVNNFSEVSNELIDEMKEELSTGNLKEVEAIADDLKENLTKINHHGKRADTIVKGMLQHSRSSTGQKELTDLNAICDEYLRLAYHGYRSKDKSFNTEFETNLDPALPKIKAISQDIGRVVLNLINNAFYAVNEKAKQIQSANPSSANPESYLPKVTVSTKHTGDTIEITVSDNGNGIPASVVNKIFQPFFTTKPTGQGTGLGLSLSYDIITKGHGGEMKVETKEGEGTLFIIKLNSK